MFYVFEFQLFFLNFIILYDIYPFEQMKMNVKHLSMGVNMYVKTVWDITFVHVELATTSGQMTKLV